MKGKAKTVEVSASLVRELKELGDAARRLPGTGAGRDVVDSFMRRLAKATDSLPNG